MNQEQIDNNKSFDIKVFTKEVLVAHNIYRELHGVPHLMLDKHLSAQSQDCASLFALAVDKNRVPTVGENIYILGTNNSHYSLRGEDIVNEWYHQTCLVSRQPHEDIENTSNLNFTQMVWMSSQLLGVGVSQYNNRIAIVCQYKPIGNINGEFLKNVLPVRNDQQPKYADEMELYLV